MSFIKSGPLIGGYVKAPDTMFSFKKWFDGRYQKIKTDFCNDNTGFRPDLVRLNNQIDYSLFDKCHAGWTLKGQDQFLFQSPYINSYFGKDYFGYQSALERLIKLKGIQDTLSRLGKSLILVYAANKATYYPEYFPNNRVHEKKGPTNFETYRHIADSLGINQIDMDTWFVSMKNKSKEILFSKQGIHWTAYGAILAGDSLIRYIERLRNVHLPHPEWSQFEHTTKARSGDDDVSSELNLIFPIAQETFAYPVTEDVPYSEGQKLKAVYIGDSYGLKLVNAGGVFPRISSQIEYYYYFEGFGKDWKVSVNNTDCVILVYTSFNLWNLGNGFIEQAYDHYYPLKK